VRTQLVREPPPGCRLDYRGELAGRPTRPLLAALLSLADPRHRPGRGDGTGRLPGRLDRSFEAEEQSVAAKRAGGRGFLGSALILMMASGATLAIQVRSYLLVPPQELTVRYKGGCQWVVLRALGQELASRSS